jgi:exodeoxyribonuclease V beta subunit
MHRLLKWFIREKLAAETVAVEERQLRLESDRDLVQIVTMHASKGLEYDVVMIPMAGFVSPKESPPCLFHESQDGQFHTLLDFAGDEEHLAIAGHESLAEDMRLLYVAITRARSRCYIGIPDIKDLHRSAVARLLRLENFDAGAVEAQLKDSLPDRLFEVHTVSGTTLTRFEEIDDSERFKRPAERPSPDDHWKVHSYTGVSRLVRLGREEESTQPDAAVIPGYADDDEASEPGADDRRVRIDRFRFPRGPRAGVALHTLMENLDFDQPLSSQSHELERCLDRVGIVQSRDEWHHMLSSWIDEILRTPLPAGCALGDIPRKSRLDEMEFHFPLDTDAHFIGLLQQEGYLPHARGLSADQLAGVMTGLIDLVIEHDGRYWLIDYKSNHLGDVAYTEPLMREAVEHHQYDLQYLIYCVALIRYLRSRLPGFEYDKHFGGVCYLFMRGMDGNNDSGIYFDRPDETLVSALDEALGNDS